MSRHDNKKNKSSRLDVSSVFLTSLGGDNEESNEALYKRNLAELRAKRERDLKKRGISLPPKRSVREKQHQQPKSKLATGFQPIQRLKTGFGVNPSELNIINPRSSTKRGRTQFDREDINGGENVSKRQRMSSHYVDLKRALEPWKLKKQLISNSLGKNSQGNSDETASKSARPLEDWEMHESWLAKKRAAARQIFAQQQKPTIHIEFDDDSNDFPSALAEILNQDFQSHSEQSLQSNSQLDEPVNEDFGHEMDQMRKSQPALLENSDSSDVERRAPGNTSFFSASNNSRNSLQPNERTPVDLSSHSLHPHANLRDHSRKSSNSPSGKFDKKPLNIDDSNSNDSMSEVELDDWDKLCEQIQHKVVKARNVARFDRLKSLLS